MGRLVSVVLVTWNSAETLPRCLEGLAGQTHRELELIVVDNASTDGSAEIARPSIRNPANRGFSAAVNQALAIARGEFVLLLNPDAWLEPDYIESLIAALDAAGPSFGMATGKLFRGRGAGIEPAGEIDSMGMRMTRSGRHLDITELAGRGSRVAGDEGTQGLVPLSSPATRGLRPATFEVFGPSGAAALHRMSMLRDVAVAGEVLDEDFFAYREDADLAWRARLFGWRALYVPDAIGYHVRRVTPERRAQLDAVINMHSVKNRFLLRLKNEGLYLALRNAPFELSRDLLVILAVLVSERTSRPALSWLWRNRRRVLEKRREIQRRRVVSDRALAGWFR